MGNQHYVISRNGQQIEAGYGVAATCEQDGCKEQINRGLDHLCGETPGGDEYGCGGYFCSRHLYLSVKDIPQRCPKCFGTQNEAEEDDQ